MTSRERFMRMFEHKEADRIPIIDNPWRTTIKRWQREGMPGGISFADYFDLDHTVSINTDNSPRYETKTVEETDEYRIYTTNWGATKRSWKSVFCSCAVPTEATSFISTLGCATVSAPSDYPGD